MDVIEFLKSASPFGAIEPEQLRKLAEKLVPVSAARGSLIVREGEQGKSCYLIRSGQVEILQKEGRGEKTVASLGPGTLFGETSLLTESPRNATVRAVEPTELLELKREDFLQVLGVNRQLSHQIFELMALRDRPKRKAGIEEHPLTSEEGIDITVLKDPSRGTYYRLSPEGLFLWKRLDGRLHLKDLTLLYLEQFKQFAPYVIAETISGLVTAGFVEGQSTRARFLLAAAGWKKAIGCLIQIMEWRWMIRDVDEKLSILYQRAIRHLFNTTAQILLALISLGGVTGFVISLSQSSLHVAIEESDMLGWGMVVIALIFSAALHEAGHAFATKAFGRKVLGLGIGWNWISPILFVDTSDIWLAPRRQRIAVHWAGPYTHLILGGIVSLLFPFFDSPSIQGVLRLFAGGSYLLFLLNLIPAFNFDGHYLLKEFRTSSSLR